MKIRERERGWVRRERARKIIVLNLLFIYERGGTSNSQYNTGEID